MYRANFWISATAIGLLFTSIRAESRIASCRFIRFFAHFTGLVSKHNVTRSYRYYTAIVEYLIITPHDRNSQSRPYQRFTGKTFQRRVRSFVQRLFAFRHAQVLEAIQSGKALIRPQPDYVAWRKMANQRPLALFPSFTLMASSSSS